MVVLLTHSEDGMRRVGAEALGRLEAEAYTEEVVNLFSDRCVTSVPVVLTSGKRVGPEPD